MKPAFQTRFQENATFPVWLYDFGHQALSGDTLVVRGSHVDINAGGSVILVFHYVPEPSTLALALTGLLLGGATLAPRRYTPRA